jgi:hypothetical protein
MERRLDKADRNQPCLQGKSSFRAYITWFEDIYVDLHNFIWKWFRCPHAWAYENKEEQCLDCGRKVNVRI